MPVMNNSKCIQSVAAILLSLLSCAAAIAGENWERVVLISLDGLTAKDAASLTDTEYGTPVLGKLASSGRRALSVTPTTPANTFPNHVTMVTGTSASRHGIFDNDKFAPGTDRHGLFYHYYSDIKVPTLFSVARSAGLKTAAIWWPLTTGAPVDHLLANIPGDVRERGALIFATASADIREVLGSPEQAEEISDDLRLRAAIAALEGQPDFLALHFTALDSAQHQFGIGSKEARLALQTIDGQLGEFIDAMQSRGMFRGATIIVASDHGFTPVHTAVQPGYLFRDLGLVTLAEDGSIEQWLAYPWPGGVAMAVYINPEAGNADQLRVRADDAIAQLAGHPADFVHAVYRGEELARWGGYPQAYAIVNLRDGFAVSGGFEAPLLRDGLRTQAVHGFVPDRDGTHGALILYGAGVTPGSDLGVVAMEDIAPTIAALLSVTLPQATGVDLLAEQPAD